MKAIYKNRIYVIIENIGDEVILEDLEGDRDTHFSEALSVLRWRRKKALASVADFRLVGAQNFFVRRR